MGLTILNRGIGIGPAERVRYSSQADAVRGATDWSFVGLAWPGSTVEVSEVTQDIVVGRTWLGLHEFTVSIEDGRLLDTAEYEYGRADEVQQVLAGVIAVVLGFGAYAGLRRSRRLRGNDPSSAGRSSTGVFS